MTSTTPTHADYLIIGAGIAGASTAYWLAPHASIILLERESQPGYHSTGRSAAHFMEGYGPLQVRRLSVASQEFFLHPPEGFSEHELVIPRAALTVASPQQAEMLELEWEVFRNLNPRTRKLTADEACALVPVLRRDKVLGGIIDPEAADMDVHAIHGGYLHGARQQGAHLVCNAGVEAIARGDDGLWQVTAGGTTYTAKVLINAAGAWADTIATMAGVQPLGLEPRRRSAFTFPAPEGVDVHAWPMVMGIGEDWYFKPDAGQLLGSPANADPTTPHDVQPEELDVATGIYHIEEMTTLQIRRPSHTWAGLRTFSSDGAMVNGYDDAISDFFWVAGQGGYGIQSSPAMGMAAAALALRQPLPEPLQRHGLTEEALGAARLRTPAQTDAA